jgi:uncharacterized membrane protein
MQRYFIDFWFAFALVLTALLCAGLAYPRRRRGARSIGLFFTSCGLAMAGLGGAVGPSEWALWLVCGALGLLCLLILAVILSGRWSARLAAAAAAVAAFGAGALVVRDIGWALTEAGRTLAHLEATEPWWLLLLLLVPIVILLSYRSLAGLGPRRRWIAIGLRSALVILLTMALADVRLRHANDALTVLFAVDRSLSVPEEWQPAPETPTGRIDRRWERVKRFINESVEKRGLAARDDKVGMVVFGRRPRLELPPSSVPRLNFKEVTSPIDSYYTDIGAALKLALASFPEGTAKRIVLISDGNENLGSAETQARVAKKNDVQIDVLPLAAGYRNQNDVMVQGVEAPPVTEQSSQLPIRVLLRSYNPHTVVGTLTLRQIAGERRLPVPPSPMLVRVRPGLNAVSFRQSLGQSQQSYTYEAIFQPKQVVEDDGTVLEGQVPEYRPENKRATTHVIALGQRRVLVIEQRAGDQELLLNRLRTMGGESKFKVHAIEAGQLPQDKAELGVFLSNYDTVILANVPAELLSEDQQEMIRSNTHEQGCGLIMIGGPEAFGAGGWQGTPVEKALPVDCDIKSIKVQGKGGLVLLMHASEMADGNYWQKEIAKLAIRKLSPVDEVGILFFDWGSTAWHVSLQPISNRRGSLLRKVDTLMPGDMPEFDTGLQMAYQALTDPRRELTTKHVIIISDGDPSQSNKALLNQMKNSKVTVTTVGVATHGAPQDQSLSSIAKATGGRFYNVKSAKALPSIYIKETRLVSQSFVYEKRFEPRLLFKSGPTEKLPDALNPLYGFVRTTAKTSPLVQVPIMGPPTGDQEFPILAYWHYGLGKAIAFTSDARSLPTRPAWDRDWAGSDMYLKFWEQVVDWSLRAVETGRLTMSTEYHDGRVKVTVDARDRDNKPMTDLTIQGAVTAPAGPGGADRKPDAKAVQARFEQKNSGIYEAEFPADEAGSYFINAQARRTVRSTRDGKEAVSEETDSVRAGVTVPYSPEFADMESNAPLLEKVRSITGGETLSDSDEALEQVARSGAVFRHSGLPISRNLQPVWYWLLLIAALALLFDVATRRIAVDPSELAQKSRRLWERLRGRALAPDEEAAYLERLRTRKAQVVQSIDRARSAQKFESQEVTTPAAPQGADESVAARAPAPRPAAPPPAPAKQEEQPADYASRLLKAKQRVWEERGKEPDQR